MYFKRVSFDLLFYLFSLARWQHKQFDTKLIIACIIEHVNTWIFSLLLTHVYCEFRDAIIT